MNRRQFLKSSALMSALPYLNLLVPNVGWGFSAGQKNQFVVMLSLDGGWDTSLASDPFVGEKRPDVLDMFVEYRNDELLRFGEGFVAPGLAPLKNYFSHMSLINGLFLNSSDVGHPVLKFSQSGNGQGELASITAEWNESQKLINLGTLVKNSSVFTAGKSLNTMDLAKMLTGKLSNEEPFEMSQPDVTQMQKAIRVGRTLRPAIEEFNAEFAQEKGAENGQFRPGQVVAKAFKLGLSTSADFTQDIFAANGTNIEFDTHDNHVDRHLKALTDTFAGLNQFLNDLAAVELENGKSVLDHTTVLVVSDFSRTPALTGSRGKNHNPQSNSMIVMGPGLNKSKIIGASRLMTRSESPAGTSLLVAVPLDRQTQKPARQREGVFMLRPDNVMATVYKSLGVEPTQISSSFEKTLILKELLNT